MKRVFAGKPLIRAAFWLSIIAAPLLTWQIISNERDYLSAALLVGIGGLALFAAWPRPIHIDVDRLWQRNRFGHRREIAFVDVDSVAGSMTNDNVLIGGGDVVIKHTMLHENRAEFLRVLEQLTGKRIFWGDA
jgi:hypothetical protein